MPSCLGVDIGGTKIAAGIVDDAGRVLRFAQTPTDAHRGGRAVLETAIDLSRTLLGEGDEAVCGIGVGCGGQIDCEQGIVLSATDLLPGWAGIRIRDEFEKRFGVPVFVDNDVNALASGEARFGSASGKKCVVFLALGTGVGGALLLDGSLYRGARYCAAEFGHIVIDFQRNARRDLGGSLGTLEAYASGAGLAQTYAEIAGVNPSGVTGFDVARLAEMHSSAAAVAAIEATGEYLGVGLASLASIFDPDLILIGGGLASLGERLLAPARRILSERCPFASAMCPVEPASLGAQASLIGASSLCAKI